MLMLMIQVLEHGTVRRIRFTEMNLVLDAFVVCKVFVEWATEGIIRAIFCYTLIYSSLSRKHNICSYKKILR